MLRLERNWKCSEFWNSFVSHFYDNSGVSITWVWKTQYYLTVTSAYDSPTPLSGWFDSGTGITENVTSPIAGGSGIRYVATGWTGTGSIPASGSPLSRFYDNSGLKYNLELEDPVPSNFQPNRRRLGLHRHSGNS